MNFGGSRLGFWYRPIEPSVTGVYTSLLTGAYTYAANFADTTTGAASFIIRPDGTWAVEDVNNNLTLTGYSASTTGFWATQVGGSEYVRFTLTSITRTGDGKVYNPNGLVTTVGTSSGWLSLATARTINVDVFGTTGTPPTNNSAIAAWTIEIATNGAGTNIVTSGTIDLNLTQARSASGGGGGGSVIATAYMPGSTKRAGEFVTGDELLLLDSTLLGTTSGIVISNRTSTQKLLTLVSSSGIRLTCSDNTPLTLEDGSCINSTRAVGHKLPVQDANGFRWEEIVDVIYLGTGEVATIFCNNQCYAAGDEPNRWIWTHNLYIQKI